MRRIFLIPLFIVICTLILDISLVPNISGEWAYGHVNNTLKPGDAQIFQRGNNIRLLMTWTPNVHEIPPHYEIKGIISQNLIHGQWINYSSSSDQRHRDFSAIISNDMQSIRIIGSEDPDETEQLNLMILKRK